MTFAFRRGQRYGTLLTGIETGAPPGLIDGRDARPLVGWLAAHPAFGLAGHGASGEPGACQSRFVEGVPQPPGRVCLVRAAWHR